MAGFTTHLSGAAISAGIIASSFSLTGLFSVSEVAWVWAVGVGAGLLPDIDSDTSVALKALFNVLGVVASLAVLVFYPEQPLLYLWAMMLSAFVLCRFVIMEAFVRFTVHRGALHSILAGGMFGLLTVALVSGVLEDNVDYAWAMGVAVFFGYLTHLILDELSSVNLSGAEIKRSFGSAFKLFSLRHLYTSLIFAGVTTYLCVSLPQPERLLHALLDAPSKERLIGTLEWMQAANHRFLEGVKKQVADL